MPSKLELLAEADKRGLLTGEKKALFDEAVRRGLVGPTKLPVPDIKGASDRAVAGVATAMPELGSFNDVARRSGGNIPAMAAQVLSNPAVRVGMGSQLNDYGENLQRLGQRAGEMVGVLGPNDRAVMEQRLSVDDAGMKAMRDNRAAETYLGRGITDTAAMAAVPAGVGTGMTVRTLSGALINGLQLAAGTGEGESPWSNFMIGATGGAIGPVLARGVGAVVNRLSTKPIQVIQNGKFTPEAIDTLERAKISPEQFHDEVSNKLRESGVTKEMLERFNLFREMNIQPTMANITGAKDDWVIQRELQKRSGKVTEFVEQQDIALGKHMDALIQNAGGKATDNIDAGNLVARTVFDRVNAVDSAIDDAYKAARATANKDMRVSVPRLAARLRALAPENTGTKGMIDAVVGDLERRGLLVDMSAKGRRTNVEHIEEARKYINALISDSPRERSRVGRMLKDALDDDVAAAVGDDVFAPARKAKAEFERSLERVRMTRRDAGKDTLLEMLIDNRGNPDQIIDQIQRKSTRSEDVGHLRRFLESGSPEQVQSGQQAVSEIKSALLRDIYIKATGTSGINETGAPVFSGVKFKKALDAIGNQKLTALFSPEELSTLGSLARLGELRIPPEMTALGGGPSSLGAMAAGGRDVMSLINAADPQTNMLMDLTNRAFRVVQQGRAEKRLLNVESQLRKATPSRVPADAL